MKDVVIVGAGLTGLICARVLKEAGLDFLVLDRADQVGGRVRSDKVNGFILDRGFQIFLDAYPEARRWLDYDALDLQAFYPGARLQTRAGAVLFGDPLRHPEAALGTVMAKVGSLADKLRVLALRQFVTRKSIEQLMQMPERTSLQTLRQWGFSESFIQQFWRPFFGGVFLEPELQTSSRFLFFVMKMFSSGRACVPAQGMQQIPLQLSRWLPAEDLRLNAAVTAVEAGRVRLAGTDQIKARAVVLAVAQPQARQLVALPPRRFQSSRTLYFASEQAPLEQGVLVLNSQGQGPVNHLAVMSHVSAAYAPSGQHLLSLTVLAPFTELPLAELLPQIEKQMLSWFGSWQAELLRDDRIPYSLPNQTQPGLFESQTRRLTAGLYLGGDYTENASINGAMRAGRLLAEQVIADLV